MRQLARFIMRGRIQAIGIAGLFGVVSIFVIPMGYVSGAALGLVALRKGDVEALLVLAGAGILVLLAEAVTPARPGLDFPLVVAIWLPVLVCSAVLRSSRSQGMVLLTVGIFAALFVLGMHLMTDDVVAWWKQWLEAAVSGVKGATLKGFEEDGTLRLMNGLVAVLYGASLMITMILARWWQAILYNPGGFREEFHALRLPRMLLPAVVAALLLAGLGSKGLLSDLFMVCIMVYFFQGLAIMHALTAKRRFGWGGLAPIYAALFFFPQYVLMGLAILGALDGIVDFRARPKGKTQ